MGSNYWVGGIYTPHRPPPPPVSAPLPTEHEGDGYLAIRIVRYHTASTEHEGDGYLAISIVRYHTAPTEHEGDGYLAIKQLV